MRISTANRYDTTVDSLQRRQRDMAQAQEQMTNGKRINQPSDDPTGAARAERAYEGFTGHVRDVIGQFLTGFQGALEKQDPRLIAEAREALGKLLDEIDANPPL